MPGGVGCIESEEGVRNKKKQLMGHRLDELQASAVSPSTIPPRPASKPPLINTRQPV